MTKRVLVGGFHHESDTFNPIITKRNDIWVTRGKDLLSNKNKNSITGIISKLKEESYEIIPTLHARAVPNGVWDKNYYLELKHEFLEETKKALPLNGVCLALHGSMLVEDIGHAEEDILSSLREVVGKDIPIYCSLDMHATITKEMIENADGFVGYKEAPHTDTYETGMHTASILIDVLENNTKTEMAAVKIPMIIAGEQSETATSPMKELISELRNLEKEENILAASYLLGFPWADTAEIGVTALVVAKDGKLDVLARANELADKFWEKRKDFKFQNETYEMEDAILKTKENLKEGLYPIVLSDSGDNPTAGSSQDVTTFLGMLLEDEEITNLNPPLCYQAFYDPLIVKKAMEVGIGNIVVGKLGSFFDKKSSKPINIQAKVKAIVEKWENANDSNLVLLDCNGVDVIVTEKHVGCYDPEMMRVLKIEPEKRKIIVVKLGYLEPEIKAIAKKSLLVLTNGSTNEIFSRLEYKNIPRPIYPIDEDCEYTKICFSKK